ncbi:reverse transcriptase family protein [Verrucomicrobiaceae bacterium 227]
MILERVAEAASTGGDLQALFTVKLPKKGISPKWLLTNLEKRGARLLSSDGWLQKIPAMAEGAALPLTTIGELAGHLRMGPSELEWFADLHQRNPGEGALAHYRYRWIPKRRGGARLLMEPKESLKMSQRRILETILCGIPLHEAAHGFRTGRSIRTFSEPHTGHQVVLKMDLGNFFPSITFARVSGLFQMLGYRSGVARLLAGLCTHRPPRELARMARHLPQGAPTSPMLANAIAYRLDCRLSGLANSQGLNYTRYADDLAFSGARIRPSFSYLVGGIVLEEGFVVNDRKTRFMRASTRQRIAGVVVNEHPNIERGEFDRLKAILYNCAKFGPSSQGMADQRSCLRGRIAAVQMLNPGRGEKLLQIFQSIVWEGLP